MRKNDLFTVRLCIFVLWALAGCRSAQPDNYVSYSGTALGTTCNIIVNAADTIGLQRDIDRVVTEALRSMSVYDPGSLISRLNRNETMSVDRHIARCIDVALRVSEISGGRYDITIKPLTEVWGFHGVKPQENPDVDSLMQYVGYRKIALIDDILVKDNPGIRLDLNSVAKGYTVDLIAEMIAGRGIKDYMVEVGGEIVCRGANSKGEIWRVGIDTPGDRNRPSVDNVQEIIEIEDRALATSGNYRRFYIDGQGRRVVHTIDALTGMPYPSDLISATVLAGECAVADALATMFMAVGAQEAIRLIEDMDGISGYFIYTDGNGEYAVYVSPELQARIIQQS